VQRDRAEVGEEEQRLEILDDDVAVLLAGVLVPDGLGANPFRREDRRVLLIEALAFDAVGKRVSTTGRSAR
jgi:hypothetical protein